MPGLPCPPPGRRAGLRRARRAPAPASVVVAAAVLLALVAATSWTGTTSLAQPAPPASATDLTGGESPTPVTARPDDDPAVDRVVDTDAADSEMTTWKAAVLGIVEGVTEYLPISSTGHLLVTQRILGIGEDPSTKDAADSYAIAIQFGAILAVLVLYRRRIATIVAGLLGRDAEGRRLLVALVLATAPAVVIGLVFERPIKDNLLGPWPVVAAWAIGGVVVLAVADKVRAHRPGFALTAMGPRQALVIGGAQVLAMWPGTSRSLVTILAALAVGATLVAAVEFSFLLGLVTLAGATLYEATTNGSMMVDAYGWVDPMVGLLFAFVSAALAIRWMLNWLQTRSLAVFGWERLAAAALTVGLLATGVI